MSPNREPKNEFIKDYGLALAIVIAAHWLLFGILLFGAIDYKPVPDKFKIPEYTAINLVELGEPVVAVKQDKKPEPTKTETKKPEVDQKKLEEQKKREQQKKEAERKKREEAKKIADEKKKAEAKKIADKKTKEKERLAAQKKKREEEARKKADAEKKRLEDLEKLKKEQEELELAELNDEFSQLNDELAAEQKLLDEEIQREAQRQAEFESMTARQKVAQARRNEQMSIVETYAAVIKAEIELNWNKMQSQRPYTAAVAISLASTGEVESVELKSSNGDKAYNQSLLNAIESVSQFDVPEDPILFEENFRQLTITFGEG